MTVRALDLLKYDGYSIIVSEIVDLKQGESVSRKKYFFQGVKYVILCFSFDTDVSDVGVYLERMNGTINNTYPTDRGAMAMISFKPRFGQTLNVLVKNISSRTPNSASKIRIIIAFKE